VCARTGSNVYCFRSTILLDYAKIDNKVRFIKATGILVRTTI
jgi:hypothetical protein